MGTSHDASIAPSGAGPANHRGLRGGQHESLMWFPSQTSRNRSVLCLLTTKEIAEHDGRCIKATLHDLSCASTNARCSRRSTPLYATTFGIVSRPSGHNAVRSLKRSETSIGRQSVGSTSPHSTNPSTLLAMSYALLRVKITGATNPIMKSNVLAPRRKIPTT